VIITSTPDLEYLFLRFRLQLLEEEDDGLTCRMCLQPFWYKSELHDHLKSTHSITDPGVPAAIYVRDLESS
jgi:hypothetical protein